MIYHFVLPWLKIPGRIFNLYFIYENKSLRVSFSSNLSCTTCLFSLPSYVEHKNEHAYFQGKYLKVQSEQC